MYTYSMAEKPFLLGITGNIASGKSVVRQYLENAGAFTIDSDLLAQQTYLPGSLAYQPIIDRFGEDLLLGDGQINRSKLGRIVFNDPQALHELEGLIYPTLFSWLEALLKSSGPSLYAIEAINLFESGLDAICDANWTVIAPDDLRFERLMDERGLLAAQARARLEAQNPQEEKAERADAAISTAGSFLETWQETSAHLAALPLNKPLINSQAGLFAADPLDETIWPTEEQAQTEERCRLLARHSVHFWDHAEGRSQVNWKMTSRLAMLRNAQPRPPLELRPDFLHALAAQAKLQLAQDLVIRADFLTPALAKHAGFWPGEDTPEGLNPVFYTNYLRQQALMPAEAYHLPLG